MKNAFLTIDQLRQKRDADLNEQVGEMTKTFGQVPLALANFQQVAQDRAAKAEHDKIVESRATDDQEMQRGDYQRRQDEAEQKASDASLKSFVAGEVANPVSEVKQVVPEGPVPEGAAPQAPMDATSWRPQTDPEILAKAADDPKLGRQDDNSVRAALSAEREAADKRALDTKYRQTQTEALAGKTDGAAGRLRQGDDRIQLQKMLEAGRNRRNEANNKMRAEALDLQKNLAAPQVKELTQITLARMQLDDLSDLDRAGNLDHGIWAGFVNKIRDAVHYPDLTQSERNQDVALLIDRDLHDFAGSAQTKQELERKLQEYAGLADPYARQVAWTQAMDVLEKNLDERYEAIRQIADLSGKTHGLVPQKAPHGPAGRSNLPPPAAAPPPSVGGLVTIHRVGNPDMTLDVTPQQAQQKRATGKWQ